MFFKDIKRIIKNNNNGNKTQVDVIDMNTKIDPRSPDFKSILHRFCTTRIHQI